MVTRKNLLLLLCLLTTPFTVSAENDQFSKLNSTVLLVENSIKGSYDKPGDVFEVIVTVTNLGNVKAKGVRGEIILIDKHNNKIDRHGWKIQPKSIAYGSIGEGREKSRKIKITRDNIDYTLVSRITSSNAPTIESVKIPLPLNYFVLLISLIFYLYLRPSFYVK